MPDCKRCSNCGEVKALDEYHRSKAGAKGRHAYCKSCCATYAHQRYPEKYAANREREIKRAVAWQRGNTQRYKARLARWQEANRSRLAEAKRRDTKMRVESLSPGYVAGCLGAPIGALPPELITLKREQLSLLRLARQLKQELEKCDGD